MHVETFRGEVVAINPNIRGNMEPEVIFTEKSSKGNKLQDREVIHIFELFIIISEISIVIAIDKIFNTSKERSLRATARNSMDR